MWRLTGTTGVHCQSISNSAYCHHLMWQFVCKHRHKHGSFSQVQISAQMESQHSTMKSDRSARVSSHLESTSLKLYISPSRRMWPTLCWYVTLSGASSPHRTCNAAHLCNMGFSVKLALICSTLHIKRHVLCRLLVTFCMTEAYSKLSGADRW